MAQALSKNRAANELRAKARAVFARIEAGKNDDGTDMLPDQFAAHKREFDDLTTRAQFLAEHTPDAEIERQGGETGLVRAELDKPDTGPEFQTNQEKMVYLHKAVRQAFGGTMAYARAARSNRKVALNTKQQAVMKLAAELTRTIVGTASDASGGEFLLPLEQEQSIFMIDNAIPGLLQRARMYSMRGRTKRIPYAVQTNEEITRPLSGISATGIIGEGSTKDTREPTFGQRLITAYKYAAVAQIADEEYEDDMTGDLEPALVQLVGGELMNQFNYDITINGSNSSAPFGALHTSATHASGNTPLKKITRTTQNRIKFADALNMYVAHTHGPNSFWLVGRGAFAELPQFELSTGSGTVFQQQMATDPRNGRLLGYPIVITDFLNALGSESDFALINPDHYACALRKQLTVESSIHYAFVNDITTWRFLTRGAGAPIPDAPYAYRSASSTNIDEHSPFVTLDDVYV